MRKILFLLLSLAFLQACKTDKSSNNPYVEKDGLIHYTGTKTNHVVFQIKSAPENLHFMEHSTSSRTEILALIHQTVYTFESDASTTPVLAQNPIQDIISADGLTYHIGLLPDAKWDDGTPVTAEDVLFSFKLAACTLTQNPQMSSYLEYCKDFRLDPKDPKKFQMEMKSYYMGNDWVLANVMIVDKRVYDPTHIMDSYTVIDLLDKNKKWEKDAKLSAFAAEFKSPKFGTDLKYIKGLGPYEVVEWKKGESITLKKKANFWGKNLKGKYYDAYPDSITYKVVKEDAAAEMAIRQEQLDVSLQIPSPIFHKFQSDNQILANYNLYTGTKTAFTYLAFNLKPDGKKHKKILTDVLVRNAIAHLMPVDNMIATHLYGFAERICMPIPSKSEQYNKNLRPIPFNPAKADSLLAVAGWKDTDNDKVLDKIIDGKKQKLELTITYGKSNKVMEPILLRMKSELEKAGIVCNIEALELTDLVANAQKHDFDILMSAFGNPIWDFKELFHTSGTEAGSNFSCYGNAQTDKLIDQIRTTKDKKQFKILSDSLQKIIYQDLPIFPFYSATGKLIVHKRFNKGNELEFQRPQLNTLMMLQD